MKAKRATSAVPKRRIQRKFDELSNEYARKYERQTHILHLEKVRRLELLAEYVRFIRPMHTLDAGCGTGVGLSAVSTQASSGRLVGLDLSYGMLQKARTLALPRVSLIQSVVEQLPFRDDSFDLVYALGVIDYLEHPMQFFEAVKRVLKPGGYFIFTYPNAESVNRKLRDRLRRHTRRSRLMTSAVPLKSATIDLCIAQMHWKLAKRHFITYGNGIFTLPWSMKLSRRLEDYRGSRGLGRYLAWSCFCVVQMDE